MLDAAGRARHLGSAIACAQCDRAEFPDGLAILGRAGPWDQDCLPGGLLRAHRTAEVRWGRLLVHDGTVDFQFESDDSPSPQKKTLVAGSHQPIAPGAAQPRPDRRRAVRDRVLGAADLTGQPARVMITPRSP